MSDSLLKGFVSMEALKLNDKLFQPMGIIFHLILLSHLR